MSGAKARRSIFVSCFECTQNEFDFNLKKTQMFKKKLNETNL